MRVLQVHDERLDGGYGAESYVRRLVGGLRDAGDEVEVIAGEVVHDGACRLLDVWDPAAARLVTRRAKAFRPDVIHFHSVTRELSASVLTAAPGVARVMTVHDLRFLGAREHRLGSLPGLSERVTSALVRRSGLAHIGATMGVSERVSASLRSRGFRNVSTVGVPVAEPSAPLQPAATCRDLAMLARLAPDKGVDLAIAAFTPFDVDARLLIAGDGPERGRLEQMAAPLGERVQFLGRLAEPEVSELLARVRAVVVASVPTRRPEGSSLALVEAAMHARPVIASDDPAVAEVAARVGGARMFTAGKVRELRAAMDDLIEDDELAGRLGAEGRIGAQRRHSVEVVTAATRSAYQLALGAVIR